MNWHRPVRVFSCCALPFAAWLTWQLLKAGLGWYGLAGFGSCCCFTVLAADLTGEIRTGNGPANRVSLVTARAWLWCSLAGKAHRRAFRAVLERQEAARPANPAPEPGAFETLLRLRRERLARDRAAAPGSSPPLTAAPPPMRPWSFPAVTVRELEAAKAMLEAERERALAGRNALRELRPLLDGYALTAAALDRQIKALLSVPGSLR